MTPKDFCTRLDALCRSSPGSVFITFKQISSTYSVKKSGRAPLKTFPNVQPDTNMCIVRATDGHKQKISTLIAARDLNSFQIALDKVLRSNFVGFEGRASRRSN